MNQYQIPLSGLNCGKCVKKLEEKLLSIEELSIDNISKHAVTVTTTQTISTLFAAIESLKYQPGTSIDLDLQGLGCGKCIKKVKTAFESNQTIVELQVEKDHLSAKGLLEESDAIKMVEELGYKAGHKVSLSLSGLNCGKCVAKVEKALAEQTKATDAEVTKTSLELFSPLNEADVIALVESLGFHVTSLEQYQQSTQDQEDDTQIKQETEEKAVAEPVPLEKTVQPAPLKNSSTVNLLIEGMTCASCVSSVEKACLSSTGVTSAQVNLAEQSAIVSVSSDKNEAVNELLTSISNAGYKAKLVEDAREQQQKLHKQNQATQKEHKKNSFVALAIGAPLMLWGVFGGNMMIQSTSDQIGWGIIGVICFVMLSTAGRSFYSSAWQSILHGRATMDTLVALGTGAAWLFSTVIVLVPDWFPPASRHVYYEASAMIIGLISLGHYIEAKAKARTNESLQALIGLQPKTATLVNNGVESTIAIEEVQPGMKLRIKPGEKVPVDGVVANGESYVDESMLTGEPVPKLKAQGGKVSAGTINNDGSLLIDATGVGSDTMLSRIIQLVRQAQSSKPAIAKLADSISAVFVPVVVGIAILASLVWWQWGPEPKASYMLIVATTVLIIACPCALGLATPLSITVGVGKAAELGILIRDADVLQTASKIDTVVFDKTGTLTKGEPEVLDISLSSGFLEADLLRYAYALESHSEHPLAKAICTYAELNSIPLVPVEMFNSQRGKGVSGQVSNKKVEVASVNHVVSKGLKVEPLLLKASESNAWTPVVVVIDDIVAGVISIADAIKDDSKTAISKLQKQGVEVVLLTGDNHRVADEIASKLNINTVIAEVLPDQKAMHISELQSQGKKVAMVGDGINDAPALAQADIGIAMGSGSDVAIESAQLTLLNSSPVTVDSAIQLSKATVKNMKQNLFGAFIYNTIGIPVAAGVLYPLFGFLLNPVIGGAAMALSSITVVSNANRLRLFNLK
ncbi:heavy metal translocating P-type ATPase [Vibrio hannami]|uniref:heavy metal translocating P-type ATPase n=1 Tax=Vibrio hannami TaxID=2717094 RepID=UPI003EBBF7C7